ncbi:MAG: methionyl-tRNA formyltransferase [Verrucomicrobia bacterium]|nr:MAG: methionyl-tRNA formyltransferase [Verrucomicrobiota bacterium]
MRIVFVGAGAIGVPTLRALLKSEHELVGVVTQTDKPVGRAQSMAATPVKKAMLDTTARILQPARIKDQQAIEERGAAPIQAAIAAGDRETGITVMYMDEGLDTGDILLQRTIDIRSDDTGGSLHDRLAQIAPDALLESLRMLAKGTAPRIPQDTTVATYAPKLKREDGKIDWSEPAEVIERKIRAFNPWPGAFMRIDGRNLKIFSASIVDCRGAPGEILRSEKELVIAAGKDALSLGNVQLEGKRRMSASEFLHGHAASSRTE